MSASLAVSNQAQTPAIVGLTWKQKLATFPGKMRVAQLAIIAASLLFGTTIYSNFSELDGTIHTVKEETAPSVISAEKIGFNLAAANTEVANFFLATKETDNDSSWALYRQHMNAAQSGLLDAAKNITFGDEERSPILDMMQNLASYERLIGQARVHRQDGVRTDIDASEQLMRNTILKAADKLGDVNFDHMRDAYKKHKENFDHNHAMTVLVSMLLLGILVATQLYVMRRTRRTINLGLALATLAVVACTLYATTVLPKSAASLREAKEDAFDSVHALWQARSVAYDANADESFYLLDDGNADKQKAWTDNFTQKSLRLFSGNFDKVLISDTETKRNLEYQGFLGKELANITYINKTDLTEDEATQARKMLQAWEEYLDADVRIRKLESEKKYSDALTLDIGNNVGQSDWAFKQFDNALLATLAINDTGFKTSTNLAENMLSNYKYWIGLSVIFVILASFLGLKVRIDEYRFE